MKQKYVVFRKYGGVIDGWLLVHNEFGTSWFATERKFATPMTLKQASKSCFKRNKEVRDWGGGGYIYGYEPE
jgi:hypothetical protein